jgi:adenine-specific DNA glycosylase
MNLPGIGESTTGALLSIFFNKKSCIDGNVIRVFARLMGDNRNAKDITLKKSN